MPVLDGRTETSIDADSRKSAELLKMLPDAFLFTGDGRQGNSVRLKFRPNPKYRPPSSESKVFHHMEGILLIDAKQIRLAKLSGTLVSDVEFGFGILGKLQKGGTFEVVQSEVAPNDWEVSLLDVHISGRALFFHTIGEQQHEVKSQFEPVRPDLGVAEAAARVARDSDQTMRDHNRDKVRRPLLTAHFLKWTGGPLKLSFGLSGALPLLDRVCLRPFFPPLTIQSAPCFRPVCTGENCAAFPSDGKLALSHS